MEGQRDGEMEKLGNGGMDEWDLGGMEKWKNGVLFKVAMKKVQKLEQVYLEVSRDIRQIMMMMDS